MRSKNLKLPGCSHAPGQSAFGAGVQLLEGPSGGAQALHSIRVEGLEFRGLSELPTLSLFWGVGFRGEPLNREPPPKPLNPLAPKGNPAKRCLRAFAKVQLGAFSETWLSTATTSAARTGLGCTWFRV